MGSSLPTEKTPQGFLRSVSLSVNKTKASLLSSICMHVPRSTSICPVDGFRWGVASVWPFPLSVPPLLFIQSDQTNNLASPGSLQSERPFHPDCPAFNLPSTCLHQLSARFCYNLHLGLTAWLHLLLRWSLYLQILACSLFFLEAFHFSLGKTADSLEGLWPCVMGPPCLFSCTTAFPPHFSFYSSWVESEPFAHCCSHRHCLLLSCLTCSSLPFLCGSLPWSRIQIMC